MSLGNLPPAGRALEGGADHARSAFCAESAKRYRVVESTWLIMTEIRESPESRVVHLRVVKSGVGVLSDPVGQHLIVDMIMMFINARPRYNLHILLTQVEVS